MFPFLKKLTLIQLFSSLLGLFLHCFIDFEYFSAILGGFLMFGKNFEIQDGGSKMAVVFSKTLPLWNLYFHSPTVNTTSIVIQG